MASTSASSWRVKLDDNRATKLRISQRTDEKGRKEFAHTCFHSHFRARLRVSVWQAGETNCQREEKPRCKRHDRS
jgi:hypothetical protein